MLLILYLHKAGGHTYLHVYVIFSGGGGGSWPAAGAGGKTPLLGTASNDSGVSGVNVTLNGWGVLVLEYNSSGSSVVRPIKASRIKTPSTSGAVACLVQHVTHDHEHMKHS